jgi:hypothetical protein
MSDVNDKKRGEWSASHKNPIVILAALILAAVFVMIGMAILGWDHGFLAGLAEGTRARGLITYLFTVVTIGVAVALVLAALAGPEPTDSTDRRFQRGKEILSLLLGVFGTIVGFYFGAETAKTNREEAASLQLSNLDLAPQPVGPAGMVTVRAVARGGVSPVRYGVAQDNDKIEVKDIAFEGGWLVKQLKLRPPQEGALQSIHLIAEDSAGKRVEQVVAVKRSAQD